MDNDKQLQICRTLEEHYQRVMNAEVTGASLCHKGRLSLKRLDLGCSTNSHLSSPPCYQALRKLKMLCEGVTLSTEKVAELHAELIHSLENIRTTFRIYTKTELAKKNIKLYRKVCCIPESSTIFRLAGLNKGREEWLYYSDDELINAATAFLSFTELKNQGGELHRHIKGRELECKLILMKPSYAIGFYSGLNERIYRSIPELTVGNFLILNKVNHIYEMSFSPASWSGTKSLKPDFYFPDQNAILEISQTFDPTRGSRRKMYVERTKNKELIYNQVSGLQYRFIDCDPYFQHQGFDVKGWVEAVAHILQEIGVSPGRVPDDCTVLRYENCETKNFYLNAPLEAVVDRLFRLEKISGLADFYNKHSPIKNLIRSRQDNKQILQRIRDLASSRKSATRILNAKRLRELYAPIESVQKFLSGHDIRTQKDWNFFAKSNKNLLHVKNIPANLPLIYKKSGQWTSWTDVFNN